MKKCVYTLALLFVSAISFSQNWLTAGNSGTSFFNSVGTTDNKSLRFRTNATLRAILDSNGRLGIGITAPLYTLDVSGNSRISTLLQIGSSTSYPSNTIFSANGGVSMMHFSQGVSNISPTLSIYNTNTSSKGLSLITSTSGSAIVFDSSGWFGISPEQKSNVTGGVGNGNRTFYKMFSTGQSIFSTSALGSVAALSSNVGILNTNNNYTGLLIRGSSSQSADLLQLQNNSGDILARIEASGKGRFRGAEYSGYLNSFQLSDSAFTPRNYVDSLISHLSANNISAWGLSGNPGINPATSFIGTTDNKPLIFKTNNAEALRVDSAGNLGIGKTAPTSKIDVEMTSASQPALSLKSAASQSVNTFEIKDAAGTQIVQMRPTDGSSFGQSLITINQGTKTNQPAITVNNIGDGLSGIDLNAASGGSAVFENFNSGFSPRWQYINKHAEWWSNGNVFDVNSKQSFLFHHSSQPDSLTLMTLKGQTTQTGDMLKVQNGAGTDIFRILSAGGGYFAGNVGIGTTSFSDTSYKLYVEKGIRARKVKVDLAGWADYVFDDEYRLSPLSDVEKFVAQNKHLPDMPSTAEVETNGLDLGANQALLLKKIEELTLYAIEQNKKISDQQKQIDELRTLIKKK